MQDTKEENSFIIIRGAREGCLKNVSVNIPKKKITVVTGVSGSGKTSLIINTLYRNYLLNVKKGNTKQPLEINRKINVDNICGADNIVLIDNKNLTKNNKATIGTSVEINQILCKLYSHYFDEFKGSDSNRFFVKSKIETYNFIKKNFLGKKITIFSSLFRGEKIDFKLLLNRISKLGFSEIRINKQIININNDITLSPFVNYDIELIIDKFFIVDNELYRLNSSLDSAWHFSNGSIGIFVDEEVIYFSKTVNDLKKTANIRTISEDIFSFLREIGSCKNCNGTGEILEVNLNKLIPNKELSIAKGAITFLGIYKNTNFFHDLNKALYDAGYNLNTPIKELPTEVLNIILYGKNFVGNDSNSNYLGILHLLRNEHERYKTNENYCVTSLCPICNGSRVGKESLIFKVKSKSVDELLIMEIESCYDFFYELTQNLPTDTDQKAIKLLNDLLNRLSLLVRLKLGNFSLNTPIMSLSGGEYQRIKIIRNIIRSVGNEIFIFDELSIGLSNQDCLEVVKILKELRELGNSIIIIEHNPNIILNSDFLIAMGPGSGPSGGEIIAQGFITDNEIQEFITKQLSTPINLPIKTSINENRWLKITNCSGNNLQNIDLAVPLHSLVCITGPSGSGKSSLINYTLLPALKNHCYNLNNKSLAYSEILGFENLQHVIGIEQNILIKTSRSILANYIGFFSIIKNFFISMPIAKLKGYNEKTFSYSKKASSCCHQDNFCCKECLFESFDSEVTDAKYKGKSIADILFMNVYEALLFFSKHIYIKRILNTLCSLGLGYLRLNQNLQTLSTGEFQRLQLSVALAKGNKNSLYIFDEPSIGLQVYDINLLLILFKEVIADGSSIIVIEHNQEIIDASDYIVTLGPLSGYKGGRIVQEGHKK